MEIGIVIWIALSMVAGVIALNKGRSVLLYILLSLILSPLVGILAALIARPNQEQLDEDMIDDGKGKRCPYCAEVVKIDAILCRYCGKELGPHQVEPKPTKRPAWQPRK